MNVVKVSGRLTARDALRWTPARQAVIECRIEHVSRQDEAGIEREVSCELSACLIGPLAQQFEHLPLGVVLLVEGFLASRSARQRAPVLHIRTFELMEGIHHGF